MGLKNMILWRVWSPTRVDRIFQEGNGFHGTQEPFGCANFPPNPPRERFYRDFAQPRKCQGAPWPSMVPCVVNPWYLGCPWVGPLGPLWAQGPFSWWLVIS